MNGKGKAKYKKIQVDLPKETLALYAGQKVRDAIKEVTTEMNLIKAFGLDKSWKQSTSRD